jgi:hypothetical protein
VEAAFRLPPLLEEDGMGVVVFPVDIRMISAGSAGHNRYAAVPLLLGIVALILLAGIRDQAEAGDAPSAPPQPAAPAQDVQPAPPQLQITAQGSPPATPPPAAPASPPSADLSVQRIQARLAAI